MIFLEWAVAHNACHGAVAWIKDQPKQDVESLWNNCTNPEWMLWAHVKAGTDNLAEITRPVLYLVASDALKYVIRAAEAAEFYVPEKVSTTVTDDYSLARAVVTAKEICSAAEEGVHTRLQHTEYVMILLKVNLLVTITTKKTTLGTLIYSCLSDSEGMTPEQIADFIRCNIPPPKIKLD